MPKEIQLKKAQKAIFLDQDSSWMALDLPEIKPPLYSKAFIVFMCLFLLTGFIYSAVTEVPVVVESLGKLASEKPAIPVRANSSFVINDLIVKENQVVKVGEVLVTSSDGLTLKESTAIQELGNLLTQINRQQPMHKCENCYPLLQRISLMADQLSSRKASAQLLRPLDQTTRDLAKVLAKLAQAEAQLAPIRTRIAQLSAPSSRLPASAQASAQASNQNSLPAFKPEPLSGPNKIEIQGLQEKLLRSYEPYSQAIQKLRENLSVQTKDVGNGFSEVSKASSVKAPFDGKIVNIRVKGAGEMIGNGQPLMELVPIDNRLLATIEVLNKDIGSVHVGDPVDVAIDAYPESDYGFIKGTISEILPAEGNEQPAAYGQDRGFRVRVSLSKQELKVGESTFPLLTGMTIRARTTKKQETLLRTFYKTIFRIKEDLRVHS